MFNFVLRRLLSIIPVLLLVSMMVFGLIHLIPGDPAMAILGSSAEPDQVEQMRERLGLNQPLPVQYWNWLTSVLSGDMGLSLISDEPVTELIKDRLPTTLTVALAAFLLSLAISLPAGIVAALRHNRYADYIFMGLVILAVSVPSFWLALLFMLWFSVELELLPMMGWVSVFDDFWRGLQYLLLPALSLACIMGAIVARMTRSSMLEVLREDYIVTALAKGTPRRLIIMKHALKNAFAPVLTILGFQVGFLLGGTVVIEDVYSIPGVGRLIFGAITNRDYPVVQGCILMVTTLYVLINASVDVAYAYFDPRVSYKKK
ncbi:MAG: ABC transporter permease [Desulfarculaceae bacterium]|nr:ABC transporter permease [Desulfarculaceae bacterium]MCF8047749.1 ABC transporter permease [Desulfarculaceae bacterium]MCF8065069.1 ABC transporter permease [Desulfarculaceae bacterium]MCF8098654.1 ABC transporter permease [Desulfarculaceae bacterium]